MASGIKQRFFGLCLPPLLFAALDYTLTLCGQSAAYWSGDYSRVNEGGPFLSFLLSIHPLAFVAGCLFLACCATIFILVLPDGAALLACLISSFSNAIGVSTWILSRPHGYQLVGVFSIISGVIVASCLLLGWKARSESKCELGISPFWRWSIALLLLAVICYLGFCPRFP